VRGVIFHGADFQLLTLLLNYGADIDYADGEAMQLAAACGSVELLQTLLQVQPNSHTLYMAVKKGLKSDHEEQTVIALLDVLAGSSTEVKPDVNHKSALGNPLLFYALQNYPHSLELAKALCDLGANLGSTVAWEVYDDEPEAVAPSSDEVTPLIFALANGATDDVIVDVLIPHGGTDFDAGTRHMLRTC
jgi:hypothetical protein